jgi:branched-chain amino acid transport system ATP-binding protein
MGCEMSADEVQPLAEPLLELSRVSKAFGGVKAVNDVSFTVVGGEIHGLIGPNGSGKTTLLNLISGALKATAGRLTLAGADITRDPANRRARRGIARTFQLPTNFPEMTALHNVMIGLYAFHMSRPFGEFIGLPRERAVVRNLQEKAELVLDMMDMTSVQNELAGGLPLGYQRWLGMSIAIGTDPVLLLLDEPLGGMNQGERRATMEKVRSLRDSGITVLLVEHDVKAVLSTCDVVTAINAGQKIAEGTGGVIRSDPAVIEAYLGREDAEDA